MAINTNDFTVERKYLQTYRMMIREYELVKQKSLSLLVEMVAAVKEIFTRR